MTIKAESYLRKAEQFESLARTAKAVATKTTYEHLAWSYRRLAIHVSHGFQAGKEQDGLAERIIASPRKAHRWSGV
jgi:hypothetical protein